MVLLNVYALEIFLILIIIEFLVLIELTKPSMITLARRKNITVLVVICSLCSQDPRLKNSGYIKIKQSSLRHLHTYLRQPSFS